MEKKYKRGFRLLQTEAILTSMVITMPVINLLFNDIGMSQLQVGISQAIFMIVALTFDVPTGWLADRFSRKAVNMFGDLIAGVGLLLYASAGSFTVVVISEIIVGLGLAATNGADVGLLRAYSEKLGKSYAQVNARLSSIKPLFMIIGTLVAGYIGTYNIRWPFVLAGIVYFVGAFVSLFIPEIGTKRITGKHPLRDMIDIGSFTFRGHRQLRWRVFAGVFTGNLTHTAVFILTPIFLAAGYEISILGIAWALMWAMNSVGAIIAKKIASNLSVPKQVLYPSIIVLVSYLAMAISINKVSVWLFLVLSASFGWFSAVIAPIIQHAAPDDIQSTVISFASVLRRLFYIPLVIIINGLGSLQLEYSMLGSAVIYGAMLLLLYKRLVSAES